MRKEWLHDDKSKAYRGIVILKILMHKITPISKITLIPEPSSAPFVILWARVFLFFHRREYLSGRWRNRGRNLSASAFRCVCRDIAVVTPSFVISIIFPKPSIRVPSPWNAQVFRYAARVRQTVVMPSIPILNVFTCLGLGYRMSFVFRRLYRTLLLKIAGEIQDGSGMFSSVGTGFFPLTTWWCDFGCNFWWWLCRYGVSWTSSRGWTNGHDRLLDGGTCSARLGKFLQISKPLLFIRLISIKSLVIGMNTRTVVCFPTLVNRNETVAKFVFQGSSRERLMQ